MNEQTITIAGMTCGACIKLVTKMLSRVEGVKTVLFVDQGVAKVSVNTKYTKESFAQVFAGTPYTVERVS